MNILTGIVGLILVLFCIDGVKKGLVDGLVHLASYILGVIVIVVLVKGVGNFLQGSYLNVLIALILLVAVRLINRVIKLILDSLKIASKLPIVSWANHLLGIILGMIRGILIIWFLFILIGYFDFFHVNTWIMDQVSQSVFLTSIYKTNLFVPLLLSLQ